MTITARPKGLGWPSSASPSAPAVGWPRARPESPPLVAGDATRATRATHVTETVPVSRETWSGGAQTDAPGRPVPADTDTENAGADRDDRRSAAASLTRRQLPRPAHTRILTVANQKGGVGKTTTAVNVAAALAQGGLSVLVLDCDPQGNASTALGIEHHSGVPSIYDVLIDDLPLADAVQACPHVPGLAAVPATIDLAGAEIELVSLVARETRLLRAVQSYLEAARRADAAPDYLIIDCPPSLGLLTLNAFVAGDEVLIPIQCEYYALEGLSMLMKNIEMIQRHLNPRLHISTILLTMYDARTKLASQVAEEVRSHFPGRVLATAVPRSVRVSEAPSYGQTVVTYDPTCSGALSYVAAAQELAEAGPR